MQTVLIASAGTGSTGGKILFVVVGALVVLGALAQVINPALGWRMNRWQFKNPDAMQPSAAGLTARRVIAGIVVVVGIAIVAVGISKF